MSLAAILTLGFFLGMRHATDADHVAAVSTIVAREKTLRAAVPIGVLWGLGHTLAIMLVGGAIVVFRFVMPPRVGLGLELLVALMLIALGTWNLVDRGRTKPRGAHPDHAAKGEAHDHHGCRVPPSGGGRRDALSFRATRPLLIGLVHGLAGSAAVALLVLATIERPVWAVGYLFVFGLGTVAGMALITTLLATPFVFTAGRFTGLHRGLALIAGSLSVALGASMIYEIGFVHGLFTSHPLWTPR